MIAFDTTIQEHKVPSTFVVMKAYEGGVDKELATITDGKVTFKGDPKAAFEALWKMYDEKRNCPNASLSIPGWALTK